MNKIPWAVWEVQVSALKDLASENLETIYKK